MRHGHEAGEVTLGGRRVAVERPRAQDRRRRAARCRWRTYAHFADRDPLTRVVLEQMLAGVSHAPLRAHARAGRPGRRRRRALDVASRRVARVRRPHRRAPASADVAAARRRPPGGADARRDRAEGPLLRRRAWAITTDGIKVPLGLWDGSTENKTVTAHLLADLVDRGLDVEQGVLVVLDGSKALRAAVDEVFGPVPVQRCVRHKERNVLDHLPERDRPAVKTRLRRAWASDDHALALDGLRAARRRARAHAIPAPPRRCARACRRRSRSPASGSRGRLKRTLRARTRSSR